MTFIPLEQALKFDSRIKKAPETIRFCPVCRGSGEFDTPSNMGPGVPDCQVCAGTGHVDMALTCICGKSAVLFKEGLNYCGREGCFNSGRHRRTGFGV